MCASILIPTNLNDIVALLADRKHARLRAHVAQVGAVEPVRQLAHGLVVCVREWATGQQHMSHISMENRMNAKEHGDEKKQNSQKVESVRKGPVSAYASLAHTNVAVLGDRRRVNLDNVETALLVGQRNLRMGQTRTIKNTKVEI